MPAAPDAVARRAEIFAALGDATRLGVVARLVDGAPQSIARLTDGTALTRQAVTKHLRMLAEAGVVRGQREGRETLFRLEPQALADARDFLDVVARQWDDALARLKAHVEQDMKGASRPDARGQTRRR